MLKHKEDEKLTQARPALPKPNNLTVEQAFAIFMEKYSEAMKELSEK